MYLNQYSVGTYSTGAPLWKRLLWYYIGDRIVQSSLLPLSGLKVSTLRIFGARIGHGTRIKNHVKIKFPWRLCIGENSWIGESVWIDNLAEVLIEDNVCISQGVYLCTGNHDWKSKRFDLKLGKITIQNSSWICAKAVISPGVTVKHGAVLSLGSIAISDLDALKIYSGNPAKPIKHRELKP